MGYAFKNVTIKYIKPLLTTFPCKLVNKKSRKSPFGLNLPFGSTPNASNHTGLNPLSTFDLNTPIEVESSSEISEELTDQTMKIAKDSIRETDEDLEKFVTIRVISGAEILSFYVLQPGDQIMVGREEQCELHLNNIAVSKSTPLSTTPKRKSCLSLMLDRQTALLSTINVLANQPCSVSKITLILETSSCK